MPDTPTPETLRALVERLRQHAREYRLDAQGDGTQLGHERKRMLAEGYDRSADELAALLDTAP